MKKNTKILNTRDTCVQNKPEHRFQISTETLIVIESIHMRRIFTAKLSIRTASAQQKKK